MKRNILLLILFITAIGNHAHAQITSSASGEKFTARIVAGKLSDPWEVIYGPDNHLWVTEAHGYTVSRIEPDKGTRTVLLDLNNEKNFPRYDKLPKKVTGGKPWPQGGLMGMALHPQLLTGKPYVYLAYIYHFAGADSAGDGCAVNSGGCYFKTKLVRYVYNKNSKQLIDPVILCDSIPGSNDHNGGRLTIAPVKGKYYVFYAVGDMGAGQFSNGGRPNHAQQVDSYEGKILRFNTLPDTDTKPAEQWIPNDNPFSKSMQSAVWSIGHRNPQGLKYVVINGKGRFYSSEHGPYSDDEINIIEEGKNYGHPLVLGYADGNYNGLAASVSNNNKLPGKWHTTYPDIKNEELAAKQIGASQYRNPIKTLYPNSHQFLTNLYNNVQSDVKDLEWASEAPSSLEVYTANAIPGWHNSLLLPTLKGNKLIRLKLNDDGSGITGDTLNYFKGPVRYRDIAISPNGLKLYLAVDSGSVTSGPSKADPKSISYRGCIVEFTYQGAAKDKNAPQKKINNSSKAAIRRQDKD